MKNLRNKSGFTLIEVMIVIAIIGILAAIVIPNYIVYRDRPTPEQIEIQKAEEQKQFEEAQLAYFEKYGLPDEKYVTLEDLKTITGKIIKLQADLTQGPNGFYYILIRSSKGHAKRYNIDCNLYTLLDESEVKYLPALNLEKENGLIG